RFSASSLSSIAMLASSRYRLRGIRRTPATKGATCVGHAEPFDTSHAKHEGFAVSKAPAFDNSSHPYEPDTARGNTRRRCRTPCSAFRLTAPTHRLPEPSLPTHNAA